MGAPLAQLALVFKALDRNSGEEIILLDRKWGEQLDCLRRQDRSDELICQGCRFPVRVRAGKINRWHFAHKQLRNCHYGKESPELLQARAVLYRRLQEKFGDHVTLEKQLDIEHFRRPVDCWVERPGESLAYWIFDRGTRPQVWDQLRAGFAQAKAKPQWLFTESMLREYQPTEDEVYESGTGRLYLSTTEREFMQKSFADEELVGTLLITGQSLHYLDAEQVVLTSFRRLRLVHSPHLYEGHRHQTALSEVLVSGKTGEFGHPGERERARELHGEKVRLERERREREKQERARQAQLRRDLDRRARQRAAAVPGAARTTSTPDEAPARMPEAPLVFRGEREGTCLFCGTRTRDWWYFEPLTQNCKCNPCLKSGVH